MSQPSVVVGVEVVPALTRSQRQRLRAELRPVLERLAALGIRRVGLTAGEARTLLRECGRDQAVRKSRAARRERRRGGR